MLRVTHITSRTVASLSDYTVLPPCCSATLSKHFQEERPVCYTCPPPLTLPSTSPPPTDPPPAEEVSSCIDWGRGGGGGGGGWGSLSVFLQHHVQQETTNWSVKQGCSLQVATGWAHLPLNSVWQVRSQPGGGARHPTERREARGCGSYVCSAAAIAGWGFSWAARQERLQPERSELLSADLPV